MKELRIKIPNNLYEWLQSFAKEQRWSIRKTTIVALRNYKILVEHLPVLHATIREQKEQLDQEELERVKAEFLQAVLEGRVQ